MTAEEKLQQWLRQKIRDSRTQVITFNFAHIEQLHAMLPELVKYKFQVYKQEIKIWL